MRTARWIVALATAAALLAGCGSGSDAETYAGKPRPIHLTLNGYAGPENVGALMAQRRDYFDQAGLEASITSPVGTERPITYVVNRSVDLSIAHLPQVALAQERGAPIVAVASVIPQPTAAMIWLQRTGINGIADLKGRTIGIPGPSFQRPFLEKILDRAGLTLDDVEVKRLDYQLVPALVSGRVDAIFGGSWNIEGVELETRGLEPVVTKAQDLGIPDYEELVLIARRDRLARDPGSIRDFIAAMLRGTEAAVKDPKASVNVVRGAVGANPDLTYEEIEAEVEATLPLLSTDGEMSSGLAEEMLDWMQEEGMLRGQASAPALLTNEDLSQ